MSQPRKVNTIGRIPAIVHRYEDQAALERKLYSEEDFLDRVTGRFKGCTEVMGVDSEGIRLRTDSYAVPEMWLEATLSWEMLDEVLKERKRSV